jgi:putative transposase
MKAKSKVIKCKIVALTERKRRLLDAEYAGLQTYLQTGKDTGLCKTNMRQAKRFYKKVLFGHDYPLTIRKDLIRFVQNDCKLSKFWVPVPVGGPTRLWMPVQPHTPLPEGATFCESKVLRSHDGTFWVHLVVEKEIPSHTDFKNVLAVDLGERLPATTVLYADGAFKEPRFYGRELRGVRRHYSWLRKRLGEKKALATIRKVGHTEHRKVNDVCHKISHSIVEQANRERAAIVLGELKGIRGRARGRRMNRIISNMPYYKLTSQFLYKAAWLGRPVYQISERNTSKTCHRCGSTDTSRIKQPIFECHSCGLLYNADLNAAKNLAERFLEQVLEERGSLAMPVTPHEDGVSG